MAISKKTRSDNATDTKTPVFLSAEDFFGGGQLKVVEIPSLSKDGRPAKVHLRQLPAGVVLDFIDSTSENLGAVGRRRALMKLIAQAVVTPDGKALFDETQINRLDEIPVTAFNELSLAVTEMAGLGVGQSTTEPDAASSSGSPLVDVAGKDSGAPLTSDSSTGSLVS